MKLAGIGFKIHDPGNFLRDLTIILRELVKG